MTENVHRAIRSALGSMSFGPASLSPALEFASKQTGSAKAVSQEDLASVLLNVDELSPIAKAVRERLSSWDFARDSDWAGGTETNSRVRRERIYDLMCVTDLLKGIIERRFPPYLDEEREILIAKDHEPWYEAARSSLDTYYWDSYSGYLRDCMLWPEPSIQQLNNATNDVMKCISSPWRNEIYQSKGLVVGHVQSGKTANFTGVIAKAADAGYRLFIILAGTVNMLRFQTQRRIDKELIGIELLEDQYQDDAEWQSFLSHGGLPSSKGFFDWIRLTGPEDDYKQLKFGIESLEFHRTNAALPFYERENVQHASARIMVVKKNPTRLAAVARDLSRIRAKLAEIPTLVIDDESDQASINTFRPEAALKEEQKRRTTTNRAITTLLQQLPRAQYIGYTATPFANVFVDPEDPADIFPSDFILSLPRPMFYMGASDFHDLEGPKPAGLKSNELAYVRDVVGDDELVENLPRALDSFILSGAIKLFRQFKNPDLEFKHHTLLIHESHKKADHQALADKVDALLIAADYNAGDGIARLERLWQADFAPVCAARNFDQLPVPKKFGELLPHIGECLRRLNDGKRILVVNSEHDDDTPDFERRPQWKIIVGGTKLSRGYTVEGLTISYFRRKTAAADTLMQMGRWFGYRRGYRDLVRLFIGREEPARPQPDDRSLRGL